MHLSLCPVEAYCAVSSHVADELIRQLCMFVCMGGGGGASSQTRESWGNRQHSNPGFWTLSSPAGVTAWSYPEGESSASTELSQMNKLQTRAWPCVEGGTGEPF